MFPLRSFRWRLPLRLPGLLPPLLWGENGGVGDVCCPSHASRKEFHREVGLGAQKWLLKSFKYSFKKKYVYFCLGWIHSQACGSKEIGKKNLPPSPWGKFCEWKPQHPLRWMNKPSCHFRFLFWLQNVAKMQLFWLLAIVNMFKSLTALYMLSKWQQHPSIWFFSLVSWVFYRLICLFYISRFACWSCCIWIYLDVCKSGWYWMVLMVNKKSNEKQRQTKEMIHI